MGKKKVIKTETNGDSETTEEVEGMAMSDNSAKKGKKKIKNLDCDKLNDDLEKLTLNAKKANETITEEPDKKEKKSTKSINCKSNIKTNKESESEDEETIVTNQGGIYAALMMDEEEDMQEDEAIEEVENYEENIKEVKFKEKKAKKEGNIEVTAPVEKDEKVKKGSKKDRKSKKHKELEDDDDIDKILAELESEYKGEKPKEEPKIEEKGKEIENFCDLGDPPEDEGSKKRKKKKKGNQDDFKIIDDQKSPEKEKEKSPEPEDNQLKGAKTEEIDKVDGEADDAEAEGEGISKKKKKKKKKPDEDEDKKEKGKPNKKVLAAMKEILAKQKEEDEKRLRDEEEKNRLEDERIRLREEAKRLEQEKKDRKKQKEKERKERLKSEGKLLTAKQKLDAKRAQDMLDHLKAQGVDLPEAGEKRPRPGTRIRTKKSKVDQEDADRCQTSQEKEEEKIEIDETIEENKDEVEENTNEEEFVADAWDQLSDAGEDDDEEDNSEATKKSENLVSKKVKISEKDVEDDEDEDDDNEDESDDESESDESEEEHKTEAEKKRSRAEERMTKRKEDNEKKRDPEILRAPVVCVLGHVDHGKTKILDKLRRTNVQEGEVGGITQQIGATNVPFDAVRKQTHMVKDFDTTSMRFPGLLIIDTPGHESFSNLRTRGSSLCDIAILVVDITQGLEPQTVESINLLKKKKTPFIVALNKVDRVFEWESNPSKDIRDIIKLQKEPSRNDFDRRTNEIILALNNQALNAALFWENPDPRSYVSLVPTSAISGDGMGNLIAMICDLCQNRLSKQLMFSEQLQCNVLEVKTIQGHGTTIDVILINGRLREGDTMIVAGTEGPIVTQIRSLLLPKPLKEIRVKGQYDEFKEVEAAQGVKIAARDLEKAIAGLNLMVSFNEDEIDFCKEEVDREFTAAMRSMKVKDRGVVVQASTLGALEALLAFFKTNDIPYSSIRVGPVVKRDVMRATAMLEHDPMYAVILAFDVKVERDAQDLADKEGVKIFSEETIYHLGDRYVDYIKDYKKKKQDEFKHIAVFPCRLKIIPTAIFNKRDPIVLGVSVDQGTLRTGTPLCVPVKEFVEIGIVTSMEFDHKNVEMAKKGVDVCIKIEPVPGHTPKLFGRHFDENDILASKITRESINACKDYFRDDLGKGDWKLMAELKKEFDIL